MLKLLTLALLPAFSAATTLDLRSALKSRASRVKRGGGGINGPKEELETWKDSGTRMKSSLSDDSLLELASSITAKVYSQELHGLVDAKPSRFFLRPGNRAAAKYIKDQFKDMGLIVTEQKFTDDKINSMLETMATLTQKLNAKEHTNVAGMIKGGDLAHEVVVLGAHYDSVNWENLAGSAPGVDDNGSGCALMLATARFLTGLGKKFQPRRSLLFVAFDTEEIGLLGSDHFAKMFRKNGGGVETYGDPKAVLIADEVAWPGRGKEQRQATFETVGHGPGTSAIVDTLANLALIKNKTSSVAGDGLGDGAHNFLVNYHGFGSDHISFLDEGIPAVLLIERDNDFHADTWGHSARDTFEHVDLRYGASMTRLALRTVVALANPAT